MGKKKNRNVAPDAGEEFYFPPETGADPEEDAAQPGFALDFAELMSGFAEIGEKPSDAPTPREVVTAGETAAAYFKKNQPAAEASGDLGASAPSSGPAAPDHAEPEYAEPEYTEPEYAEPEYTESDYADDRYAGPTVPYAGVFAEDLPGDSRPGTHGSFVQLPYGEDLTAPEPRRAPSGHAAPPVYSAPAAPAQLKWEPDDTPEEPEPSAAYPDLKPDYSYLKPRAGSYAYEPYPSAFDRLFGKDRFYGVASVASAVYSIFWTATYIFLLLERSVMFTNAQMTMAARGEMAYTVVFSSPMISVLRVLLYLLPVVLLVWAISVKHADKTRRGFGNKKITIVVLCLLLAVGAFALFDVGAAGLVFDVMKM